MSLILIVLAWMTRATTCSYCAWAHQNVFLLYLSLPSLFCISLHVLYYLAPLNPYSSHHHLACVVLFVVVIIGNNFPWCSAASHSNLGRNTGVALLDWAESAWLFNDLHSRVMIDCYCYPIIYHFHSSFSKLSWMLNGRSQQPFTFTKMPWRWWIDTKQRRCAI